MEAALTDVDEIKQVWLDDYPSYAEEHLKILLMDGGLIPFKFNPIQVVFHAILDDIKKSGRFIRAIILKARREGLSSYTCGRFFHKTATTPHRYAFQIAHEPDATNFLFGIHKRFYNNLDPRWRPSYKYNNISKLEFNNPNGDGLDSAITVATAGKQYAGSSQLVHMLHLSELSKWPGHTTEELLTSILQCVPDSEESEVIDESTANGIGGKFYERYWSARFKYKVFLDDKGKIAWKCEIDPKTNPSNTYSAIFFPYFVFPNYQVPVQQWEAISGIPFERTKEEQAIVDLHLKGVPERVVNEKLCWRRITIENKCKGDVKTFNQEYPSTDIEAFVGSGQAAFDVHQILKILESAPEPIAKYDILPASGEFIRNDSKGLFWVWQESIAGRPYLISADVAEGIEIASSGGETKYDFSIFDVIDMITGMQVAQWHGHIDADILGRMMCFTGRRYNMAWLVPERNNHGQTTVSTIMNANYPRLYVERIPDPPNRPRKRYGWLTTRGNKSAMVDEVIMDLRESALAKAHHGINSKRTLQEMLSFKRDEKGQYGGEVGQHDDCVMSWCIGRRVRPSLPTYGFKTKLHWSMPVVLQSGQTRDKPRSQPRKPPRLSGWN